MKKYLQKLSLVLLGAVIATLVYPMAVFAGRTAVQAVGGYFAMGSDTNNIYWNGGAVGINTSSPTSAGLSVVGVATSSGRDIMKVASSSGAVYFDVTAIGNIAHGTTTAFAFLSMQNTYGSLAPFMDIATTTSSGYATTSLFRVQNSGNVGIGTGTPTTLLQVGATATATVSVMSSAGNKGGRIILMDVNGTTCSEISSLAGALTTKVVTCP